MPGECPISSVTIFFHSDIFSTNFHFEIIGKTSYSNKIGEKKSEYIFRIRIILTRHIYPSNDWNQTTTATGMFLHGVFTFSLFSKHPLSINIQDKNIRQVRTKWTNKQTNGIKKFFHKNTHTHTIKKTIVSQPFD